MRGIRYDPERRKGSTLFRRTDLLATLARLAAACFAVAFALLLAPDKAYAASYGDVIYGPSVANGPLDNTSYYVQVYAFDRYTAALGALGYDTQDSRFTSDVKAYLSNSSTGGAFYDFAQLFTDAAFENNGDSVVGGTVGIDDENFSMYFAYRQNVNLYGSNVWWAQYTTTQSLAARTSVGLILAGNVAGGGGSGGGSVGDTVTLDTMAYKNQDQQLGWQGQVVYNLSGVDYYNFTPYNDRMLANDTVTLTLTEQLQTVLNDYLSDGGTTIIDFGSKITNSGNKRYNCSIQHYPDGISVSMEDVKVDKHGVLVDMPGYFKVVNSSNYQLKYYQFSVTQDTSSASYVVDAGTYTERTSNISGNNSVDKILSFYGTIVEGSSGPVVPPTNWPTDPTPNPPTQPTVPNPPTGGTPNPPTDPNPPSDPIYGTQPIYITNTFTADFQGLLDALDEHCKHLQNALYFNFSGFYLLLTTKLTNDFATLRSLITAEFVWLGGTIEQTASDMMLYLKDLFEWLADQFDFSVSGGGYDDETVVSWLKKIYSKLGGGVNTRPTDPVSDPFDIGQWLKTLFGNLFTALDDLAGGLLSQLASWVGGLAGKFPFSIPWDIAAILGLLVADPVAPNFDVPWYTLNGSGTLTQAGLIEVDLADWSQYLEGVRFMIKVCFVMFLAMHTKDFMELMEKAVGLDA